MSVASSCVARKVSIHASSREDATGSAAVFLDSAISFNPRVLAGGRDWRFQV